MALPPAVGDRRTRASRADRVDRRKRRCLIASRRYRDESPRHARHATRSARWVVSQRGQRPAAPHARLAPPDQLVNTLEFEDEARRALAPAVASLIADRVDGTGARVDRQAFDRITLRPRMLVPTLDLDLTMTLFGD